MTHLVPDIELREPREDDWQPILLLANQSVQAVAGAGSQEEWLHNRQRPASLRRHVVAVESGTVVGYAAIESQFEQVEQGFRLFVVASPERLAQIGGVLYRRIESLLSELGALESWFIEYASDHQLLAFLGERGFREVRRFRLERGTECVVVSKHLGT